MFKQIVVIIKNNFVFGVAIVLLLVMGYNFYQSFTNPPEIQQFKGGIQNHLVWSIKGECYFVKPHTTNTIYLIRVEDCDKGNK
jgi:hypothetical protein